MNTPKLPTTRELAKQLREINTAYSHPVAGGEYVQLYLSDEGYLPGVDLEWRVAAIGWNGCEQAACGREYMPGDTRPGAFNAMGVARRLLAAARDEGFK